MKSVKKFVLAALMAALMAFALCACGGSNVEGTYVVSEYNGQSIDTALAQMKEMGVEMTAETLGTITLASGNKATLAMMGASKTGTYEVSGETLKITIDGETQSVSIKDGVITYTEDGTTMKMKKK